MITHIFRDQVVLMENVANASQMMTVLTSHVQHVNQEFAKILSAVQIMNVPTINTAMLNMSVRMAVVKTLIV